MIIVDSDIYCILLWNSYLCVCMCVCVCVCVCSQCLECTNQFKARGSVTGISGSMSSSATDMLASQKRIDIDSARRNAPIIHTSQARTEMAQLVSEKVSKIYFSAESGRCFSSKKKTLRSKTAFIIL